MDLQFGRGERESTRAHTSGFQFDSEVVEKANGVCERVVHRSTCGR